MQADGYNISEMETYGIISISASQLPNNLSRKISLNSGKARER